MQVHSTYTVQVTDCDIQCGRAGNSVQCPIAIAMRRAMSRPVSVGAGDFILLDRFPLPRYLLPPTVDSFILDYDAGQHHRCLPFSFQVSFSEKLYG